MSWLVLVLQATPPLAGTGNFDLARQKPIDFTVVPQCQRTAPSEDILVCGQEADRYRLPLPTERRAPSNRLRGETSTSMSALTPAGRCGIFAGERSCSKRAAAEYGYGNGRDPITVFGRLAKKIVDPDAD